MSPRLAAVVATCSLGGAVAATAALPWLAVQAITPIGAQTVNASGGEAAPVVPAAGLVVVAAGLALALAGRVGRLVAAGAVALACCLAGAATWAFLADPEPAAIAALAAATGVRFPEAEPTLTPWPPVAAALCGIGVLGGAALARVAWAWPASRSRYERPAGVAEADPRTRALDDWDALSRGDDPSERGGPA